MIQVGARNLQAIVFNSIDSLEKDTVYADQEIVREDYPLSSSEGKALLAQLKTAYSDYEYLPLSQDNLIGAYGGYREPYQGAGISFYNMRTKVPSTLQERYGVSQPTQNLKPWYGLKFDLTKEEVMLKCLIKKVDFGTPELPDGDDKFYATTHMPDKTMSDWVDCYISGTDPETMKKFCADKGLPYPFPENMSDTDMLNIWCWGFVFNKSTLEYGAVKGYSKRYIGDPI